MFDLLALVPFRKSRTTAYHIGASGSNPVRISGILDGRIESQAVLLRVRSV